MVQINVNFTNEWGASKIPYLKIQCILTKVLKFETEV